MKNFFVPEDHVASKESDAANGNESVDTKCKSDADEIAFKGIRCFTLDRLNEVARAIVESAVFL